MTLLWVFRGYRRTAHSVCSRLFQDRSTQVCLQSGRTEHVGLRGLRELSSGKCERLGLGFQRLKFGQAAQSEGIMGLRYRVFRDHGVEV